MGVSANQPGLTEPEQGWEPLPYKLVNNGIVLYEQHNNTVSEQSVTHNITEYSQPRRVDRDQ